MSARHLPVPYAVVMRGDGVYADDGSTALEPFFSRYIDTGQHWLDWLALWTKGQHDIAAWLAEMLEAASTEGQERP
jgi:hypothetical protein